MRRHELSEAEWSRIAPLLPREDGRPGRPSVLSNRTFMNAIFYIAKTGVQWRDLPERFGPWKTVHTRFTRWNRQGVFQKVLDAFRQDVDHASNMADGTYARAHQDAGVSVLDALAEALPPKSTLSWMLPATPAMSTSAHETCTTSPRPQSSSKSLEAAISSETKATIPTRPSKPSRPKA